MRAEDIRAVEILSQDPNSGLPLFGAARIMLAGLGPLARLQADLLTSLGPRRAAVIFTRFGYETGLGSATNLGGIYDWESDLEWFKAGLVMRRVAGLAREGLDELVLDREKGVFRFRGWWKNSFEVELWRDLNEVSPDPICHILAGVVGGYASAVWGSEVWVKETTCAAQGHDLCRFEGRPVGDWGMPAEEMRRLLSLDSVTQEVGRLREALRQTEEDLARHQQEIKRLCARTPIQGEREGIITRSRAMDELLCLAEKVAPTGSTVLIAGESGTGKEVLARFVHRHSGREKEPFLAVNCAALPPDLLESELFGHVKGAFTGADRDKRGLFVEAGKGTLFLDEVGELPLALQAKLLRALQEKEVRPVGGVKSHKVEARILAATNQNLFELVQNGGFREDLYYRLAVFPINVPPLRQRKEDILPLARHFLEELRPGHRGFSPAAVRRMVSHPWPGNVRELTNAVEYSQVLAGDGLIEPDHLPRSLVQREDDPLEFMAGDLPSQEEMIRRYTKLVLDHTGGNRAQAARIMGIGTNTLWRRLKAGGEDGDE